ncbi:MAG: hypothetical protein P0S94_00665 [Simkaniaceae bacterium]|nr:hypothetical protein [Simkaniaceae bacterium]
MSAVTSKTTLDQDLISVFTNGSKDGFNHHNSGSRAVYSNDTHVYKLYRENGRTRNDYQNRNEKALNDVATTQRCADLAARHGWDQLCVPVTKIRNVTMQLYVNGRDQGKNTFNKEDVDVSIIEQDKCKLQDVLEYECRYTEIETREAVKQLTRMICATGLHDTALRNIPLTKDGRVAMIDLERLDDAGLGLSELMESVGKIHKWVVVWEVFKYALLSPSTWLDFFQLLFEGLAKNTEAHEKRAELDAFALSSGNVSRNFNDTTYGEQADRVEEVANQIFADLKAQYAERKDKHYLPYRKSEVYLAHEKRDDKYNESRHERVGQTLVLDAALSVLHKRGVIHENRDKSNYGYITIHGRHAALV